MSDPKRILIVDDEVEILEWLKEEFQQRGFEVEVASSGTEAIKVAARAPRLFDLIVSDVRMEDGDGKYLFKEIVQATETPPRFLFMSAFSDLHYYQVTGDGAEGIINKPFRFERLWEKVLQVFEGTEEELIEFPHKKFTGSLELSFKGKTHLAREFALNPKRVLLTHLSFELEKGDVVDFELQFEGRKKIKGYCVCMKNGMPKNLEFLQLDLDSAVEMGEVLKNLYS